MTSLLKTSQKQAFFDTIDEFHSQNRAEWRWVQSPYFLKTFPEENVISYLNLTPFQKPSSNTPHPVIQITMEKPLNFHPSLGWNWHKSWILPEITVKLSDSQSDSRVFVRVFVVKAGLEYSDNFFLVDIGVKGSNKVYFQNQNAAFRNLKFSSTSYNNEGLKFHLVLVAIEELEGENGKSSSNYRIIDSKLSPPIYVDSRKSAREISFKENSFLDMFPPELLQKPLFKKRRKNIDKKEEFIGNSLKGFIDYYTAPNIRNKIKHPFFIALKFSNCISLYFSKHYFNCERSSDNFREILGFLKQYNENLSKIYAKKKKTKIFLNKSTENAYLAVVIKNPSNMAFSKKVSEFLGSFDKRIIKIVLNRDELSDKYQLIEDLNQLKQVYNEEYEKLNYDGKSKLPPPEFFLEKRQNYSEAILINARKKIKLNESEDLSEAFQNEHKSETPAFIPEITTMIEVNEWQPISRREREKVARINPEELFKSRALNKKDDENNSNILSKNNSTSAPKESPSGSSHNFDVKLELPAAENKFEPIQVKNETEKMEAPPMNGIYQNNTGLLMGNNSNNFTTQGRVFPGYFNGLHAENHNNPLINGPGLFDNLNINYMNGAMPMNMNMYSRPEEYRNFMEKMSAYMNSRQKLDYYLINSLFLNE